MEFGNKDTNLATQISNSDLIDCVQLYGDILVSGMLFKFVILAISVHYIIDLYTITKHSIK